MHSGSKAARTVVVAVLSSAGLIAAGCAGLAAANKRASGSLSDGKLTPALPPTAGMGADPTLKCQGGPIQDAVLGQVAHQGGHPVQLDPRLCAQAETLLGWDEKAPLPSEGVRRFLAGYFGVSEPVTQVVIQTLDSEDPRDLAEPLAQPVGTFAQSAARPLVGIATLRVSATSKENPRTARRADAPASTVGRTKVVIVMLDEHVELQPVAKQLAPGSAAKVSGHILSNVKNPVAYVCGADGHLQEQKLSGADFSFDVHCGTQKGLEVVELRGEENGSAKSLGVFPLACGGAELPRAAAVTQPSAGDAAASERAVFDLVNADRAAAGLQPVRWDDAVAKVARGIAESYRSDFQSKGSITGISPEGRLREAGASYAEVVQNPGMGLSALDAAERFSTSARDRCNYMNPAVAAGGVGVATFTDKSGRNLAMVTELFGRELVKIDPAQARQQLKDAIAKRRSEAKVAALRLDPTLDKTAQEYADELAAARGKIAPSKASHLIAPLYKRFAKLNILEAARADASDVAQDANVLGEGKLLGVGVAQGESENLGKNTTFVLVLIGTSKH